MVPLLFLQNSDISYLYHWFENERNAESEINTTYTDKCVNAG